MNCRCAELMAEVEWQAQRVARWKFGFNVLFVVFLVSLVVGGGNC